MARNGAERNFSFRGTDQKTAVPCGFGEGALRYAGGWSQHFGGVKITQNIFYIRERREQKGHGISCEIPCE